MNRAVVFSQAGLQEDTDQTSHVIVTVSPLLDYASMTQAHITNFDIDYKCSGGSGIGSRASRTLSKKHLSVLPIGSFYAIENSRNWRLYYADIGRGH
jgi:hypothetical protein